jgi:hypothetical protein
MKIDLDESARILEAAKADAFGVCERDKTAVGPSVAGRYEGLKQATELVNFYSVAQMSG